jgi:hypothetical protein
VEEGQYDVSQYTFTYYIEGNSFAIPAGMAFSKDKKELTDKSLEFVLKPLKFRIGQHQTRLA